MTATYARQRFLDELTSLVTFVVHVAQLPSRARREPISTDDLIGRQLGAFSTLLMQMVLCRAVDAFQVYLNELLALVFTTRPETLRSSETVTVEVILEHDSRDEIVNYLAARRVERLAYESLRSVAAQLADGLGLELFGDEDELDDAVKIFESRNLIVHNRAIVNETYLKRVGSVAALGTELVVNGQTVATSLKFLADTSAKIDDRAIAKFGLPTEPLQDPPRVVAEALAQGDWPVTVGELVDPEVSG